MDASLVFVNTFNYDKRFEMFYIFMPFLIVCMLLLPGCTVVNWGKKNMYQGIDLPYDSHGVLSYIRSIKLYDQFSSLASFDVMWLADAVRLSYVDLYIKTAGKRDEQKAHLLRLQQDELKHFISFYVLVPQELLLTQPQSLWHIFLKIDELTFDPIDIKPVELNVIYKSFLENYTIDLKMCIRSSLKHVIFMIIPLFQKIAKIRTAFQKYS